jgi:hypothetical protein
MYVIIKYNSRLYEELKKPKEVLMSNHILTKFWEKELLSCTLLLDKKISLVNVFHVPGIWKNLVSTNISSKKRFKIILESDKVIVTKSVVFLGKDYSCDDMFKFNI